MLTLRQTRMIVEDPNLIHRRRAFANLRLRRCNILPVLPATGIRTVSGGHQSQRMLYAVVAHLPQRIGQKWIPVAIAPINRQFDFMLSQLWRKAAINSRH